MKLGLQPEYGFIKEINEPLHRNKPAHWQLRKKRTGEASLASGVCIRAEFSDPTELLQTAYEDFRVFLETIEVGEGTYEIKTGYVETSIPETFKIVIQEEKCKILAGDTEGIRRGLIFLEDEILRAGGPFIPIGTIRKEPLIRSRIIRCFYAPTTRAPKFNDELVDDYNYYPDEYLNRMAHAGVNGVWIQVYFRDLCRTKIIPEFGNDSKRRLEKLRKIVKQCVRYGIRVYPFCIEPEYLLADSPVLAAHPELGGHRVGKHVCFCTSSKSGKQYLYDATRYLFSEVPGLGGLIALTIGERYTHCYSGYLNIKNNCPRCRKRHHYDVWAETMSLMREGMHSVNPDAELISWPYSQNICWGDEETIKAATSVPKGVMLQHNFESSGGDVQLGKWRRADDYWLSYIGPSELFKKCASAVVEKGGRIFAKLQVSCSHEVASTSYIPSPGNIYDKLKAMHELGVSGVMESWLSGGYPSLMVKALGELSFKEFPETKDAFLMSLAQKDWGPNAKEVVRAWNLFQEAYGNYPLAVVFGYYGPMHDGPLWPLYLEPRNLPLSPNYLTSFPPSGDRIGECILYNHTYEEILFLCSRMSGIWDKGVRILKGLKESYASDRERIKEINVAAALGMQFRSGINIFRFYELREKLAENRQADVVGILERMEHIVLDEIKNSEELLDYVHYDPLLGFSSDAEDFKYYPEKFHWRIKQLEGMLKTEFPRIRERIEKKLIPFPRYTGEEPEGKIYHCHHFTDTPEEKEILAEEFWGTIKEDSLVLIGNESEESRTTWKAGYNDDALYLNICCKKGDGYEGALGQKSGSGNGNEWETEEGNEVIEVRLEPRRLWPYPPILIKPDGSYKMPGLELGNFQDAGEKKIVSIEKPDEWIVIIKIPFASLGRKVGDRFKPLKINIVRNGEVNCKWVWKEPLERRIIYFTENPEEFGWLVFE